jgi:capsular polysaccharide biosynthesis protein
MIFVRVFAAVFLLTCITSAVITFILPETYASTARVSVDADKSTECKVIQSDAVLGPAIDKLDLNAEWGRKYNAGQNLNTTNTALLLKARLEVSPEPNTRLIDIKVFSEDKNEAARIANAIADSYSSHPRSADNSSKIEIVDRATPGLAPVRPNKTLNLIVGVLAGIVLGSIAGGIAAGLVSLSRDAKPPKRDPAI